MQVLFHEGLMRGYKHELGETSFMIHIRDFALTTKLAVLNVKIMQLSTFIKNQSGDNCGKILPQINNTLEQCNLLLAIFLNAT